MKLILSMITMDRSETGRVNYFQSTMEKFEASGLFNSKTPFEFNVFDSGSHDFSFMGPWKDDPRIQLRTTKYRMPPKINAGRALLLGSSYGGDYVIFIEDDITVCKDFLDGAAAWLEKFADERYKAVTFYTPYREVQLAQQLGKSFWEYPVDAFYGTQCLAFRSADAASVGHYLLLDEQFDMWTPAYDLIMKEWFYSTHPNLKCFQATVPCFAQHTGEDSILNPGRFHQCGGFAGEEWSALQ